METLKKYYDGFLPKLDVNRMSTFESAAKKLFPHLGLHSGSKLKMLDIGGGGGFFSKALEDLGYGESTYVDLDPQSCNFAQNSLKLKRVFNCDAMNIKEYINTKFDFIYCRHVIEHLLEPITFLEKIMDYLNDNGIFVVQFPKGNSLEYLAAIFSDKQIKKLI
jgi:2-polyprenyl-3-methyl-5-hydroxy-6-metoxy-1,4-benzoquinol methylase